MSKGKFTSKFSGKGYYIALILCAVAIGITGYLYYRTANQPEPAAQGQTGNTPSSVTPTDVQVVATQPGQLPETTDPTQPSTEPTQQPSRPLKTGSPLVGQTVAEYAMDCLVYNETTRDWRVHNGVDIAAEAGTAVCAAADGTVYSVYEDETMGTTVIIRHQDGYTTRYSSLDKEVTVTPGDTVKLGQTIGYVGQTALLESALGTHVHFSVTCNGESMDPMAFLELHENN